MAMKTGRNVGRLSIRVVPDTTRFRDDLKDKLKQIDKTTRLTVRVDRAKIDRVAFRKSIQEQAESLKDIAADVNVNAHVNFTGVDPRALNERLRKVVGRTKINVPVEYGNRRNRLNLKKFLAGMREDMRVLERNAKETAQRVRDEFDAIDEANFPRMLDLEATISNPEEFQHEVNKLVRQANRKKVNIGVGAFVRVAAAQISWVARARIVPLIVRVSKPSVAVAAKTLARLTGARLAGSWLEDVGDFLKDLDKNLPKILSLTTGITSLFAAVFAGASGLLGIGQGLFSILPALLVLPGLLINAMGSLAVFIVALRNAGTELAPLADNMNELGEIINTGFWDNARQPIIDLVQGLMPQLRNAFTNLAEGAGQFTGAMADAFGREFADGRLESIFDGISEGWRVLATGADGFAGAIVSLSNVAAQYTPRLAAWFVRQADAFDGWMKATAEDGRLGGWIEGSIDSMYDLWDATKGVGGVLAGLWRASDAAGGGGLKGFAQLMQDWDRTVNSVDFQRGLTAIFRGSGDAMGAFSDAIKGIGRLVSNLDQQFETFIGSAGQFLGGLVEGIANALDNPAVAKGLDGLSGGLLGALEGILPSLPSIAATFGNFLGLLGTLAESALPAAAHVLAALTPSLDALIAAIKPALGPLGDALVQVTDALSPAIANLVEAAAPVLVDALLVFADGVTMLAPVISGLIDALAETFGWLRDNVSNASDAGPEIDKAFDKLGALMPRLPFQPHIQNSWATAGDDPQARGAAAAQQFMNGYKHTLEKQGPEAADALYEQFKQIKGLPPEVVSAIEDQYRSFKIYPELGLPDNSAVHLFGQSNEWAKKVASAMNDAFKSGDKATMIDIWNSVVEPLGSEQGNRVLAELRTLGDQFPVELFAGLQSADPAEFMSVATDAIIAEFERSGTDGAKALWQQFTADAPQDVRTKMLEVLNDAGVEFETRARSSAAKSFADAVVGTVDTEKVSAMVDGVAGAVNSRFNANRTSKSFADAVVGSVDTGKVSTMVDGVAGAVNGRMNSTRTSKSFADNIVGSVDTSAVSEMVDSIANEVESAAGKRRMGKKLFGFKDTDADGAVGAVRDAVKKISEEATAQGGGAGGGFSAAFVAGLQQRFGSDVTTMSSTIREPLRRAVTDSTTGAGEWLREPGAAASRGFRSGWRDDTLNVGTDIATLTTTLTGAFAASGEWLREPGARTMRGFRTGWQGTAPQIGEDARNLGGILAGAMAGSEGWLREPGSRTARGFRTGWKGASTEVSGDARNFGMILAGAMSGSDRWLTDRGRSTMTGFRQGAIAQRAAVGVAFAGIQGIARGALAGAGGWLFGIGSNLMGGLASGIRARASAVAAAAVAAVRSAVAAARAAAEVRSPSRLTARTLGEPLAQGVAVGIDRAAAGIRASMVSAVDLSNVGGTAPDIAPGGTGELRTGVVLNINNPVVRDLDREAWEAAQLAGTVIG